MLDRRGSKAGSRRVLAFLGCHVEALVFSESQSGQEFLASPLDVVMFARSYLASFAATNEHRPALPSDLLETTSTRDSQEGAVVSLLGILRDSVPLGSHLVFAMAAREATRLVARQSWPTMVIEGDYETLIHKLRSEVHNSSLVGPLVFRLSAFAIC
ncbi:UNVERIFIED_CONTAM: hypothetical protein Sindi_2860300 [Sesamum indicum]